MSVLVAASTGLPRGASTVSVTGLLGHALTSPVRTSHIVLRCLLLGLVYVAVGYASLESNVPDTQLSLIWPTAGIGALWLVTSSTASRRPDFLALLLATFVFALLTGPPWTMALFRIAAACAMAVTFRLLTDRWTPLRRGDGSLHRLTRMSTIGGLAAAAAAAGLLQASVQVLGLVVLGEASWLDYLHRSLRNTTAIFTIVTTAILLMGPLLAPRAVEERLETAVDRSSLPGFSRTRWAEVAALLLFTAGLYAFSFGLVPTLPMSFTLILPSIWAGVRFRPAFAALHGLVTGVTAVGLTLADIGMYADIQDPVLEAFVAQAFLAIAFGTTLALSVTRTELASAQHRAAERAHLLDRVLSGVGDGIALVEEDGRVVMVNDAARRMLGIGHRISSLSDLPVGRFLQADGTPLTREQLHHSRAFAGEEVQGEDMVVRPVADGPDRIVRVTTQLLETPPGALRQVLVTCTDVTGERAHSAALASFAGEVAHDLKNPLAVVEGWSEMLESELRESPAPAAFDGLAMVHRIQGAAAHMRTLITELLTYTLARDRELAPERVFLKEIVGDVEHLHRDAGTGPSPQVDVECDHVVWADSLLLRQVLDNLVGNAIKYVAPGVAPHVVVSSRVPAEGWVEVRVEDNGLGVPAAARPRIFDSFYRVDRPGYAGTGLGLAICQRIVQRHGGTLVVDDGPGGVGSTFSFTLPAPVD